MKPALHVFAPLPTAAPGAAETTGPQPAVAPDSLQRATAQLEAATAFLGSRYIENLIANTVTLAVQRAASPFCDRDGAAAFLLCDVSQIDRAAKAGIIKRHLRGGTPLFEKADLAEAITSGRWRK